jgi:hypothetical protein
LSKRLSAEGRLLQVAFCRSPIKEEKQCQHQKIQRQEPVPTVEMLLARSAITELLNHHSRALDRLDAEGLKSVYWPDARVDYGGFKGLAHDFADMVMGAASVAI